MCANNSKRYCCRSGHFKDKLSPAPIVSSATLTATASEFLVLCKITFLSAEHTTTAASKGRPLVRVAS